MFQCWHTCPPLTVQWAACTPPKKPSTRCLIDLQALLQNLVMAYRCIASDDADPHGSPAAADAAPNAHQMAAPLRLMVCALPPIHPAL